MLDSGGWLFYDGDDSSDTDPVGPDADMCYAIALTAVSHAQGTVNQEFCYYR